MFWIIKLASVCVFVFFLLSPSAVAGNMTVIPVLCYHDINEQGNALSVTDENLRAHFDYLKQMQYTPISLQQYKKALAGKEKLPQNPILLSFDDGYQSAYTKVLPLLEKYQYPAMFAIITSWLDDSGNVALKRQELKEMDASGLVTIASHTYQLHQYVTIDPAGKQGAMTALPSFIAGKYESMSHYRQKIRDDMRESQNQLRDILGHQVDAIVWPYGAYTEENIDSAFEAGYNISFILGDTPNKIVDHDYRHVRRAVIPGNLNQIEFADYLAKLLQ